MKMVNLIRVAESDDFIVDYDKSRGMYRVSVFQDYHFQDEYWFDAYEEKELQYTELVESYEKIKKDLKYYLDINEENGVVYIPKFVIERMVN
jgi:hypothetical protein